MFTKEEAKEKITNLVEDFKRNLPTILADKQKNEAQIEDRYIKPFFSYLNWNTSNIGLDYGKEEFVVQPHLKIADSTVRPDYLLKLPSESGRMKRHLFIEAKHPSYNLKNNVKYIRQVYQYAHSTLNATDLPQNRCPLAILTDFEEFRLFDCSDSTPLFKPNIDNLAVFNKHIVKPFDLTYKDYVEKFDLIWDLLERNNVANGSLAKWELTDKQLKENRIAPDLKFLDDLKMWRLELARSMYAKNNELDDFTISQATLMFINRIIFIKMLADRGIEVDYLTDILNEINNSKKKDIKLYELCKNIFVKINNAYNGSIFEYKKEFDEIEIENRVLIKIFEVLKPDTSVYTLAAMPVEIIGYVYEYFIAEQIVKRRNKIELVPKYEDKKASGVYYTPRYIVEYIVENTLEKKLEKIKDINDIINIKIIDPACGSGSFLIVAYQRLIDWCNNYLSINYKKLIDAKFSLNEINEKWCKLCLFEENERNELIIHITPLLKNILLKGCIYGVDIDFQAVQVTKFSLYIKLLEDTAYIEKYKQELFSESQLLPNLDNNIKCGNSLIESDFYFENRPSLFNEKEKRKINTFDWTGENGFPEIMKNGGFDVVIGNPPYVKYENLNINTIDYFKEKYKSAVNFFDIYQLFIEKSIKILKKSGLLGIIIPNLFLKGMNYIQSRKLLLENSYLKSISNYGDGVFNNVKMPTCVIISQIENNNKYDIEYFEVKESNRKYLINSKIINEDKEFKIVYNNLIKIKNTNTLSLNSLVKITRGLEIGKDLRVLNDNNTKPILFGDDISRYCIKKNSFIEISTYKEYKKSEEVFTGEKIIIRETGSNITATYDESNFITNRSLYCIKLIENIYNLKFILSIINSKFIQFFYKQNFKAETEIFPKIRIGQVKELPIPKIDFSNKEEKQKHDKLVKLVEQMLENQKYLHSAKNENDIQIYRNICTNLDQQIDSLVYQLYGLTEEEIRIVEGNNY